MPANSETVENTKSMETNVSFLSTVGKCQMCFPKFNNCVCVTLEKFPAFGTPVRQKHENIKARNPSSLFVDVIGKLYWQLMPKVLLFLLVNVLAIFSNGDVVASTMWLSFLFNISYDGITDVYEFSTKAAEDSVVCLLNLGIMHFPITLLPLTIDHLDHCQNTEISIWVIKYAYMVNISIHQFTHMEFSDSTLPILLNFWKTILSMNLI